MVAKMNPESNKLPFKSVAGGLLFSVFLGPIGLLYASYWGGFFMIAMGIIALSNQNVFAVFLLWVACCIWSVGSVEKYNKRLLETVYRT
jgi:hypothetical protein